MKYLRLNLVIFTLTIQSVAMANSYKGNLSTNSIAILYQNQQTTINHQEASTDSGFTSLASESKVPIHSIQLEASHEFFASYLFSITLSARYGKNSGSLRKILKTSSLDYQEHVSGHMYGAGGSLNLNFAGYGIKIQPFLAGYAFTHKNTYKLEYHPVNSPSTITRIKYDGEQKLKQLSLGVRFIDYRKSLLSYFSLDYISATTPTMKASSSTLSNLTNTASFSSRSFAFSLGFGVTF